ncbi:helix-turn-helix domain-containing protein [Enterococcus rivorum]|nr:helix-turn-helix domain-containing protein [Enterococcus rivorum]MBP2098186.1 hypothetical protein [Enterococcus rivorum]
MKKNEKLRFAILKKIIGNKHGVSIFKLLEDFNISNTTIYRHISALRSDLSNVFPSNEVQLFQIGQKMLVDYPTLDSIYIVDSMHLYYIKSSQRTTIIEAVLNKVYPSIESLSQDLHLSTSYTYKSINVFNSFLEKFHLKIKFDTSNSRSNLVGEEINLRVFLFFSQWMLFKGIDMPIIYSPVHAQTIKSPISHNISTSNQLTQFTHYQAITYFRIIVKKKHIQLPDNFFDYLNIFESVSQTVFPPVIIKSIDKSLFSDSAIKQEEALFGFTARYFITNIDSPHTKKAISKELLASGLPLTEFIKTFLNNFSKIFKVELTTDDYLTNYYLLAVQLIYYQYIDIDVSSLDPSNSAKTMLNQLELNQITSFVNEELRRYIIGEQAKENLLPHLAEILYIMLKRNQKKKLIIFIQYSKSIYLDEFIKNNLYLTFNPNIISFTSTIKKADIIISDVFEELNEQQQVFYLDNPYDLNSWNDLILFISNQLL